MLFKFDDILLFDFKEDKSNDDNELTEDGEVDDNIFSILICLLVLLLLLLNVITGLSDFSVDFRK